MHRYRERWRIEAAVQREWKENYATRRKEALTTRNNALMNHTGRPGADKSEEELLSVFAQRWVWELSRLWAPDGHEANLLIMAISRSILSLRTVEPDMVALVSYADPNEGHHGGIYQAASWLYCGQSEENRVYVRHDGLRVARRAFHSGSRSMKKAEIEALGYKEQKLPGKQRYARGIRAARKVLLRRFGSMAVPRPANDNERQAVE